MVEKSDFSFSFEWHQRWSFILIEFYAGSVCWYFVTLVSQKSEINYPLTQFRKLEISWYNGLNVLSNYCLKQLKASLLKNIWHKQDIKNWHGRTVFLAISLSGFQPHIDKDSDYRKQYGLYPDPDPSHQASQPYQPSSSQMQYASPLPQLGAYVAQTNYVWVFSDHPMQLVCPHCQTQIITRIKYESGAATWLLSLGICLFG